MRTLLTIDQLIETVNTALPTIDFPAAPERLYSPIRYALSAGGKRIRPVLMLMAYNLYRDQPADILRQALALETYHNFTLLHDDLIDKSDLRRGQPTVHKKWDENTAILSGDTMLVFAYRLFGNSPALDDFIQATLAGASAEDQQHLYNFGEKMGLAFQVQDDLLDVYADSNVFKKKLGGDIVENKKTYLLIQALNRADAAQRLELNYWLREKGQTPEEKIAAVTHIYNNIGIPEITKECIETLFSEALGHLDLVSVPQEDKQQLRQFAQRLLGRKY